MNPDDIIKAAPEIAKVVAPVAAAIPCTAIVKKMLGPAADELARMWEDQIRLYRYGREMKCVQKAEKMAKDAGFTPKAVPIKLLFPLLEGASLEENEDLHTMWAALLANSASPKNAETVRPGFIAILKQMAPDEAAILKYMLDQLPAMAWKIPMSYDDLEVRYTKLFGERKTVGHNVDSSRDRRCKICLSGLEAMKLIEKTSEHNIDPNGYEFTWYGYEFVMACQPPAQKPRPKV
jgi:hypothetical protein